MLNKSLGGLVLVPAVTVIIVLTTMSLRKLAEAPLVGRDGAGRGAILACRAGILPLASTDQPDQ